MPSHDLLITGSGMVSSLGYDAASSCAAARAGITRARELGLVRLSRTPEGEREDVVGHSIEGLTDIFEGNGRLMVLAWRALHDLLREDIKESIDWNRTQLFLALPPPERTRRGAVLVEDKDLRYEKEKQQVEAVDHLKTMKYAQGLVESVLKLLKVPLAAERCHVVFGEQEAFLRSMQQAIQAFQNAQMDHAIIGGVDSLINEDVINWLYQTNRLKCREMPAGLQPGEAGGFVLMERARSVMNPGRATAARIHGLAIAVEPSALLKGTLSQGVGLGQSLSALDLSSHSPNDCTWVLTDQNGEPYRAHEWGVVQTRLTLPSPWIRDVTLTYPAASFGHTGAAYGAIASCLVLHAWHRGYAPSPTACITASSDDGLCGALALGRET